MTTRTKKDLDIPAAELIMHRHWCWLLGFGVLLMILGCIGLGMVVSLTLASMFFFAALLFISGISHFADAFQNRHWKGGLWEVFIGLLYLIAAALILYDPFMASKIITAFLAWVLILIGISRISMALALRRGSGWGWLAVAGLAAIILGVLILVHWPVSGLWAIGMFIAVEMIVTGWSYILVALTLKARSR